MAASAVVGTHPSSPSPSAIMGVSLSTASLASGPFATNTTLSPSAVSRASNDVTLRAFAERSPSWRRISLLNVLATLLNTAAGRACKPLGFGRMIASEVTVGPVSVSAAARCAVQRQGQHRGLADDSRAGSIDSVRDPLAVRDDHFREQALGVGRDVVEIEFDQRRAGIHFVTDLYPAA